nr:putative reverse transcriptase domain-containing protein [Tanacetum cinerariifolium]
SSVSTIEAAFQLLKQKLHSAPILALPEGSEDFIVYCNASNKGFGTVLMQREKVISYTKREGKANVVADALSRKERVPLRVRALVMTIGLDLPKKILKAQTEARKPENIKNEDVGGMLIENAKIPEAIRTKKLEPSADGTLCLYSGSWLPCYGDLRTKSLQKALGTNLDMSTVYHSEIDEQSERTIQTLKDMLRAYVIDFGNGWVKPLPLVEFSYNNKLVQETSERIIQIKQRIQTARDRQKSYADLKHKPMEFQVGDQVTLKKCHADEPLAVSLDGLHFDDKLYFVEKPVEIVNREVKRLKRSRIPLVKDNITMDFFTKLPKSSQGYDTIWVIVDRLTKSAIFTPIRETDPMDKLARIYLKERSLQNALELNQETTEKIVQIKQRMQAARDRQKSYANLKRKPMEFQVEDKVMLKVSPWKGVVRFGKRGELNLRYVGPFKVLEEIGKVAYKLELLEELSRVHNTFHVSNLKKSISLDGLHFDDKLYFIEELVEIVDREVKRLKRSRIPLVKVRWNSKRGPEFTWEREDQFRKKYPHLFARTASLSSVTS